MALSDYHLANGGRNSMNGCAPICRYDSNTVFCLWTPP
jgi:hypothetical protein